MANDKYDYLYGRMSNPFKYSPRKQKFDKPELPPRDEKTHSAHLMKLLDKVEKDLKKSKSKKLDGAEHSLVAVSFNSEAIAKVSSLESSKDNAVLAYHDKDRDIAIIDTTSDQLDALRKKIQTYGTAKIDEEGIKKIPNNDLIAPIESLALAEFSLISGPYLRTKMDALKRKRCWFEVSCRGGKHVSTEENVRSKDMFLAAVKKVNIKNQTVFEYVGPERIIFFVSCTISQIKRIFNLVDCIWEVELSPPQTLNWLIHDKVHANDLPNIKVPTPKNEGSVIVCLDSGINSKHPLLVNSVAFEASVHPEDNSPVDTIGHGTEMAGFSCFGDDLAVMAQNQTNPTSHWIESVRVFTNHRSKIHSKEGRPYWAPMTTSAVNLSESKGKKTHRKVFSMPITSETDFPGMATSWSLAVDQLAFNDGAGRLFFVSIGNRVDPITQEERKSFVESFPLENHLHKIEDPAQAFNAITVGAFTRKMTLPRDTKYKDYNALAKAGEISPHTRSGSVVDFNVPIKPEVVFEGGNIGYDQFHLLDGFIPSLAGLTTSHDLQNPFTVSNATSMATALASKFAADLWNISPNLRVQTVRALMIHSASWTGEMLQQCPSIDDRLALCGYGVPNFEFATQCSKSHAIVLIEDEISNGKSVEKIDKKGKVFDGLDREMKIFKLPLPKKELLEAGNKNVEIRITLSYFAEPNSAMGRYSKGMDLRWEMQGPHESEVQFYKRINQAFRNEKDKTESKGFAEWKVGKQRRQRGTIQSDRMIVPASQLADDKLIAIYPKIGWWAQRDDMQERTTQYSLVVTVTAPDLDLNIYNYIKTGIEVTNKVPIEVEVTRE